MTAREDQRSPWGAHSGPGMMDVRVHWEFRDATVILTGELDCASAPLLSARLTEVIAECPERLVIDLAGVAFLDCAGITPIVMARRALPAASPLILRSPARPVRELLAITQMDQVCVIQAGGARAGGQFSV